MLKVSHAPNDIDPDDREIPRRAWACCAWSTWSARRCRSGVHGPDALRGPGL